MKDTLNQFSDIVLVRIHQSSDRHGWYASIDGGPDYNTWTNPDFAIYDVIMGNAVRRCANWIRLEWEKEKGKIYFNQWKLWEYWKKKAKTNPQYPDTHSGMIYHPKHTSTYEGFCSQQIWKVAFEIDNNEKTQRAFREIVRNIWKKEKPKMYIRGPVWGHRLEIIPQQWGAIELQKRSRGFWRTYYIQDKTGVWIDWLNAAEWLDLYEHFRTEVIEG